MWILCCDREEEVVVENTEDDEDMLDVQDTFELNYCLCKENGGPNF